MRPLVLVAVSLMVLTGGWLRAAQPTVPRQPSPMAVYQSQCFPVERLGP